MTNNNLFQRLSVHSPSLEFLQLNATPIAFNSPTFCQDLNDFVQDASENLHQFASRLRFIQMGHSQGSYLGMRSDACDHLQEAMDTIDNISFSLAFLRVLAQKVTAAATPRDRTQAISDMQAIEIVIERNIVACNNIVGHLGKRKKGYYF